MEEINYMREPRGYFDNVDIGLNKTRYYLGKKKIAEVDTREIVWYYFNTKGQVIDNFDIERIEEYTIGVVYYTLSKMIPRQIGISKKTAINYARRWDIKLKRK